MVDRGKVYGVQERCDGCGADFRYVVDGKTYSLESGMVIPGVYDGVLFWTCHECTGVRHRFPENEPLGIKARAEADRLGYT